MSTLIRAWVRRDGTRCRIVVADGACIIHAGDECVALARSEVLRVASDLEHGAWDALDAAPVLAGSRSSRT